MKSFHVFSNHVAAQNDLETRVVVAYSNKTLGGGFQHFLFSTLLGKMIHFDKHVFQMGFSTNN